MYQELMNLAGSLLITSLILVYIQYKLGSPKITETHESKISVICKIEDYKLNFKKTGNRDSVNKAKMTRRINNITIKAIKANNAYVSPTFAELKQLWENRNVQ